MPPRRFFKKRTQESGGAAGPAGSSGSGSASNAADQPQIQFDLGVEKKKVTVRKFKNMKLIDIREYYQKDGNWLPGNKGLSLTEDQWNVLVSKMVDIGEALVKLDDKEQFNIMKNAISEKDKRLNNENPGSTNKINAESQQQKQGGGEDEEEEDENFDDVEFEDVSEAPPTKRVKTE